MEKIINNVYSYIYIIALMPFIYLATTMIFDLLLRGFSPFLRSRPWVSEQILADLKLKKEPKRMLALSTGRSGFFHELGKVYKNAEMVAIEPSLFPYLVSKIQAFIRRTRIKVLWQKIHRVDVKNFDLVYSHLYPDNMQGLGPKLKFECDPGTIVLSAGFNIPTLVAKKVISLTDRKGKYDFLSKNQNLLQSGQLFLFLQECILRGKKALCTA